MYKKNKNVVERAILPSYFLVDITKCYNNEHEKMFITDEMGIEIWRSISDGDLFENVLEKFLNKLTDDKNEKLIETVTNDLNEYLQLLMRQGYVFEV